MLPSILLFASVARASCFTSEIPPTCEHRIEGIIVAILPDDAGHRLQNDVAPWYLISNHRIGCITKRSLGGYVDDPGNVCALVRVA